MVNSSNLRTVLATCGNGNKGRLGHGLECVSQKFFRIVGSLVGYDVKQVDCGGAHTACVTADGSLFTFGMNDTGQLGHSEDDKFVPVPLEVGLPDPVTQVATGDQHTLCLTSAGEVWAWGSHQSGQLGIGNDPKLIHKVPRLIKELSGKGVQQLAAGAEHSIAIGSQPGDIWRWGTGSRGALGLGRQASETYYQPTRVRGPLERLRLQQISSGLYSSGCVDDAGRAWTWGHGTWWQLGHGHAQDELIPRQVMGLRNIGSLTMGYQSSWALSRDGRVYGFGTDDHGSLGQGEGHWQRVPLATPQEMKYLTRCKQLASKWRHVLAVTTDGSLYSWGAVGGYESDWGDDGGAGQLGLGDGRDHWEPTQVQRIHTSKERFYDLRMSYLKPWKVLQASCGRNHSAIVVQMHLDMRDLAT